MIELSFPDVTTGLMEELVVCCLQGMQGSSLRLFTSGRILYQVDVIDAAPQATVATLSEWVMPFVKLIILPM